MAGQVGAQGIGTTLVLRTWQRGASLGKLGDHLLAEVRPPAVALPTFRVAAGTKDGQQTQHGLRAEYVLCALERGETFANGGSDRLPACTKDHGQLPTIGERTLRVGQRGDDRRPVDALLGSHVRQCDLGVQDVAFGHHIVGHGFELGVPVFNDSVPPTPVGNAKSCGRGNGIGRHSTAGVVDPGEHGFARRVGVDGVGSVVRGQMPTW